MTVYVLTHLILTAIQWVNIITPFYIKKTLRHREVKLSKQVSCRVLSLARWLHGRQHGQEK